MRHEIEELDNKGLRKFGMTTGVIVCILFGLLLPYIFDFSYPRWPWILGGVLILTGLILPAALRPVYREWMRLGMMLGWLNTRIILGFVFFTMFFPFAIVLKLLNKDAMARKIHLPVESYRTLCQPRDRKHYERPY